MKRALVAFVVSAACLAGGLALWSRSADQRVPAAELIPAETLLLADFPNLPATALRWKETALAQILNEPEVQGFLAKPLSQLQQNPTWAETLRSLAGIQPQQAFFAVASITNNMPHAVAGFAFRGDQRQVETLISKARAQAQTASPNGKLGVEKHGKFQIETFSNRGITLAGCFARNWYFVANDLELLKATLDRFSGKTETSLAVAPTYRESLAALPQDPDFRLFTQPGGFSDRVLAQLNPLGDAVDAQEVATLRKIRAVALATRLEGRRMHDVLFFCETKAPQRPVLSKKTLELTTENTLFYGALAPSIPEEMPQRERPASPSANPMRALLTALNSPAALLAQFKTAFGPEHAVLLNWLSAEPQPSLFLALEVRDPAKARKFMENVFSAWSRAEATGVSFWTLADDKTPAQMQIHPTVALTAHHVLGGLSLESVKPFASTAANATSGSKTLEKSPAFIEAMATVPKPKTALAYLDAGALFERVYGLLRPAAMLWGGAIPDLAGAVDFGKMPTTDSIGKHLSPICLSALQTDSGLLIESTGPVTFLEVSAGMGAVAGAILMPAIRINPSTPGRNPILPPGGFKPLSAPQTTPPPATPSVPTGSQSNVSEDGPK